MDLAWLRDQVRGRPAAASVGKKFESMTGIVDSTIEAVRRIAAELRPMILDELGLSAAVEWQAKEFQKRTGIRCRVRSVPPDVVADRDRSTALFRILQEAL